MVAIRFVLRVAAVLFLAAAVVLAVVDATRSIAADEVLVTTLEEGWAATAPALLEEAREGAATSTVPLAGEALAAVLALPAIAVLVLVALVFYALGRRRSRRVGSFVVEG